MSEIIALPHFHAQNVDAVVHKKLKGISTDSRSINRGELFIALRGENFDGHKFISQALNRGAVCAVVDRKWISENKEPVITVPDTTKALGIIAQLYRRKYAIPVIAIAGSNGKTTTKEMVTAVLQRKYNVLSTKGNLNNQFGVPLTLLRMKPSHELAVIEIGTNHFGELQYLCNVAEPTHGTVTNIGHEHLEYFKNLNGVAKEEGELFRFLSNSGTAFVNADDDRVVRLSKRVKSKLTYGFQNKRADIYGKVIGVNSKGCCEFAVKSRAMRQFSVKLAVPGNHTMMNALAAVSVGISFKVPVKDIQSALGNFSGFDKRMEIFTAGGVKILNDTYNANPDSVRSALQTLNTMDAAGKKIIVLADMRELGESSITEHKRIGSMIGEMKFDYLLTYGSDAKYIYQEADVVHKFYSGKQEEITKRLCVMVTPGDIVLIKGSRGLKMENVVAALRKNLEERHSSKKRSFSSIAN
ncbi:MAG: UDP-N-acetylmuramoyl-tripeptide--D-alanyl-D-alanine ligase [Bacteroidota bacterium]